jgi:D-aminoacyl-tRNA deacylase
MHHNQGRPMVLIVASTKDIASLNIKEQILRNYPFCEAAKKFQESPTFIADINGRKVTLVTLNEESVKAQNLPEKFPEAKLIIFISKHSSQSGKPTLSVHAPGNFGDAQLGGLPKTLSVSSASAMQSALKALMRYKEVLNLGYEVSFECTHHGPSLDVATMFVELGSSSAQWCDLKAAEAVAHSAISAIANFMAPTYSAVLGIGGTHYNQRFTLMALVGEAAFGHMIPKHAVHLIDPDMLRQCIEKTLERVPLAVLDWKGIKGEDKSNLLNALETVGLPFKKV